MKIREADALPRQTINTQCLRNRIPMHRKFPIPLIIRHNHDHIGLLG